MIGIYYSAAFRAFYVMGVHRVIPTDAVRIERDRYAELLAKQLEGARIVPNFAGHPVAVALPVTATN